MASGRRVLMVCRQHPKHHHGGLATAAWATAKAARDAGWEVVFATAQHPKKGKKKQRSQETGIAVAWLPGCGHNPGDYPKFHKALRKAFPALQKEFGFQLIHTHSSGAAPLIECGLPVVFQDHGLRLSMAQNKINRARLGEPELRKKALEEIGPRTEEMHFSQAPRLPCPESEFLRSCAKVLVLNTETLWEVRTRYFLTNAEVFHYPVYDLKPFAPWQPRSRPVIAMCASNLDNPEKGIRAGLKLLAPLKKRIKMRLIGPGTETPVLAKQLFKDVRVTGWIEQKQLREELGTADVFFEASNHHHGLNSTSVFALGLGVPVVGLPIPGTWEATDNGRAGMVVSPYDSQAACAGVLHVAAERLSFAPAAQAWFDLEFSPKRAAAHLDGIYGRLIR